MFTGFLCGFFSIAWKNYGRKVEKAIPTLKQPLPLQECRPIQRTRRIVRLACRKAVLYELDCD